MNRLKTRVKNFINEHVLFHSSSEIKFEKETSFSKNNEGFCAHLRVKKRC